MKKIILFRISVAVFMTLIILSFQGSLADKKNVPRLFQDGCKRDTFINFGKPININKAPFQLKLDRLLWSWEFKCGATILTEKVSITAAHCTNTRPWRLRLRSGSGTFNGGAKHLVRKIIKHPHYKKGHLDHDIALLIVWEKFDFKGSAKPIKLPNHEPHENTAVAVTGWSQQNPHSDGISQYSIPLRKVVLSTISRTKCINIYKRRANEKVKLKGQITKNVICAIDPTGNFDSRSGDSGGPLFYNDTLYGVIVWGSGFVQDCLPGVYINVYQYVDWINSTIRITEKFNKIILE